MLYKNTRHIEATATQKVAIRLILRHYHRTNGRHSLTKSVNHLKLKTTSDE